MGAVTKGGGRALALLVAVLAFTTAALLRGEVDGVRLLSHQTVAKAGEEQNRGVGRVVPISMRWRRPSDKNSNNFLLIRTHIGRH